MTSITPTPARVKTGTPATGTARWLLPHAAERLRLGVPAPLSITSLTKRGPVTGTYWITCHRGGTGEILGYRLAKDETGYAYDLPADLSSCECKDHLMRSRRCKHVSAVAAALENLS